MKIYKLHKVALSVTHNPAQFLNGLTSNTLDKPRNAFLDVHGKIIAVFDQIRVSEDEFLLLVERPFFETALKHLDRYAKLSKAALREKDFKVYFDLEGIYRAGEGEWTIAQRRGQVIVAHQDLVNTISGEEFTLFRLKNNIPIHGIDFQSEMLLNVDEHEYVSFSKGCFLGQEPVSKVHNRSKPTWKLIVKYEDDRSLEQKQDMTSKMIDPQTQRVFGFAFVKNV